MFLMSNVVSQRGIFLVVVLLVTAVIALKIYMQMGKTDPLSKYAFSLIQGHKDRLEMIRDFNKLMESLDIKAVLIEPSILHNMLRLEQKTLLHERHFKFTELGGFPNVVTFALLDNNQTVNAKLEYNRSIVGKVFLHWKVLRTAKQDNWLTKNVHPDVTSVAGHHFFQRNQMLVHGVIFFRRGDYLWHDGLLDVPPAVELLVPKTHILFDQESAYERFLPVTIKTEEEGILMSVNMPTNPSHFLLQIMSSRFIECNLTHSSFLKEEDMGHNDRYNTLKDVYEQSLKEFKAQLYPQLKTFYIFAGTLLGWYRQCDIIPYTSDVDYAASASDIGSEGFWVSTFEHNSRLRLAELMGMPEEAFELSFRIDGNKVDLFFIYENESLSWGYGHRPSKGYYFSYSYPKFTLCSGDLLGHKVQVPCSAEDVIATEYGPEWQKPKTGWYYETSPRNMGPRLFWPEHLRKKVSKYFS